MQEMPVVILNVIINVLYHKRIQMEMQRGRRQVLLMIRNIVFSNYGRLFFRKMNGLFLLTWYNKLSNRMHIRIQSYKFNLNRRHYGWI